MVTKYVISKSSQTKYLFVVFVERIHVLNIMLERGPIISFASSSLIKIY